MRLSEIGGFGVFPVFPLTSGLEMLEKKACGAHCFQVVTHPVLNRTGSSGVFPILQTSSRQACFSSASRESGRGIACYRAQSWGERIGNCVLGKENALFPGITVRNPLPPLNLWKPFSLRDNAFRERRRGKSRARAPYHNRAQSSHFGMVLSEKARKAHCSGGRPP